jgi:membrane protein implicated in regulation of membrane protease activity
VSRLRRLALEILGWLLVALGIAALVLPGPGLLLLVLGVALLAREYEWARRRLAPLRLRAVRAAADGVESWPKLLMSTVAALALGACGVLWILDPPAPGWWPLPDDLWLLGSWETGVTLELSAVVALVLLVISYRRFHGHPERREAVERELQTADRDDERAD